jgi:ABC-type transporter Mla maintaining outer membrane lipid asymmetry ATPase subunit MlaF
MAIPSRPAIAAGGLRKSFGDQVVLDGIDLEVPEGTIFALLGPNGAGKTTIVRTPMPSAPRSASPASSPPSTTCSLARRT